jgi:hypothetical protein|tara:strand:- start:13 stop:357 length:345 start_codon:yes stop_codon:yes gene_type:complete
MKNLFTNTELKDIIEDLPIAYIDAEGSSIHRQETSWTVGGVLEIFIKVICVRHTLVEETTYNEDGYLRTDAGEYRYDFEIDDIDMLFDDEYFSTPSQIEEVVIPILEAKIRIYG